MGTVPKTLRGRSPREQVVLGACPNCGSPRVVQPCSDVRCDGWFMVCDCNDACETSFECGGRCEVCRALDAEQRDPWEPPTWRPARNARGSFRSPYLAPPSRPVRRREVFEVVAPRKRGA